MRWGTQHSPLIPARAMAGLLWRWGGTLLHPSWRLPAAALLGVGAGMALLVLQVSNAKSYLSDRPETCINCHIMTPYYASWLRSSHRGAATCNDCHVPHDSPVRTLAFKAADGMRHSVVFTLRREPQVLKLNPFAVPVVRANCERCHAAQLTTVPMQSATEQRLCWECHREVPHGLAQSLSSTPHTRRPELPPAGLRLGRSAPAAAVKESPR